MEMDDERLVKQHFLQSAILGPITHPNLVHKSWAGQVVSFLATLDMPCYLITPRSVNVSAVVEKLQGSYLESVNACSGVKMQQYLNPRSGVESASYTPVAYLQAVGGWRQCKQAFGTTSNYIPLVGSGDGSLWDCNSRAGSKIVSAL